MAERWDPQRHVGAESARPPECAGEPKRGAELQRAWKWATVDQNGRDQALWNDLFMSRPMEGSTTAGVAGMVARDDVGRTPRLGQVR